MFCAPLIAVLLRGLKKSDLCVADNVFLENFDARVQLPWTFFNRLLGRAAVIAAVLDQGRFTDLDLAVR